MHEENDKLLTPLISVIVPCYNQAQYLDECLQSVFDQSFENWECLIINDGSPDNTEEVAKKWVLKDSRFNYFRKENNGVSAARNFGITKAAGNLIVTLDSDDKIGVNYIQICYESIDLGADIAFTKSYFFGERHDEFALDDFRKESFLKNNCIYNAAMFKKKRWQEIGGFDEDMKKGLEDWEFWIRYIFSAKTVIKCDNSIQFFYRIKSQSRNKVVNESYTRNRDLKSYIVFKNLDIYYNFYNNPKNILLKMLFWKILNKIGVKWRKNVH